MRRLLKFLKWIAAGTAAFFTVLFVPEVAAGLMVVPVLSNVTDPYVAAVAAVAAMFGGLWLLAHLAELAVVVTAYGIVHLIDRWRTRVAIRAAVAGA